MPITSDSSNMKTSMVAKHGEARFLNSLNEDGGAISIIESMKTLGLGDSKSSVLNPDYPSGASLDSEIGTTQEATNAKSRRVFPCSALLDEGSAYGLVKNEKDASRSSDDDSIQHFIRRTKRNTHTKIYLSLSDSDSDSDSDSGNSDQDEFSNGEVLILQTPPLQNLGGGKELSTERHASRQSIKRIVHLELESHSESDLETESEPESQSESIIELDSSREDGQEDLISSLPPNSCVSSGAAWIQDSNGEYFLSGRCAISGDVKWPELTLSAKAYDKLYAHQKIGVQWMASLHSNGVGGILGDDMGLGKTIQTLTFIGGLMRSRSIRNALVVCPLSVLQSWQREAEDAFKNCGVASSAMIRVLDSSVKKSRRSIFLEEALRCKSKHPQLIITTYGLVKANVHDFQGNSDRAYWDYVILDEGHQIKNPTTQQHKTCKKIAGDVKTRRLLLTGTPIQNNMKELWALFDWATSARLLGPLKRFKNEYMIPIENG